MTLVELRPWLSFGMLALLLLWESASPFFAFPRGRQRLAHGGRNLILGLGNGLIIALVFAGLWMTVSAASAHHGFGLLHRVEWHPVVETIITLLLLDAWTYWWHRMNHRIPLFWRFHRVHHSDPHMDVTTANRFHLGEIIFSSLLRVPLIYLLGIGMGSLAIYEILLFAVVQFHHANVSIGPRGDRILSRFIVTPYLHKVHHSHWQPETDSNYASLLPLWDGLFGTLRFPEEPHRLRLGLDEFATPETQNLTGLFRTPFVKAKRTSIPDSREPRE